MEDDGYNLPVGVDFERELGVDDLVEEVLFGLGVDLRSRLGAELRHEAIAVTRDARPRSGTFSRATASPSS